MRQENIRNIAIIAHVDHGKTTLVDQMLKATDAFRENQQVQERVLDSNDQERERGITILAKNISIEYRGVKINVIDTPGHADFGGEVERVLRMADGALLLVDAAEGPMPQTRFVLRHAIDAGLAVMIVVNKIDKPAADPERAVNTSLDLMADLGATDEQLEFAMEHVIYASAVNGFARLDPADDNMDMFPMLDMIVDELPAPEVDPEGPLAMQCVTIDHSEYVGRIGIGRIYSGTIHDGDKILVVKNDGSRAMSQVKQLFTFDYLGRKECSEAQAGDIAAVVGIDSTDIGDVYTDPENPVELEPIEIDPPTLSVVFEPSTSPLVGREGDIVGGRQLKERLMQERENNVTMRIEELPDKTGVEVAGRGILHLSVLMETMRREGFEFQVGRPRVLFKKDSNGQMTEPVEQAVVECPGEYSGKVIEVFGNAGGTMTSMDRGHHADPPRVQDPHARHHGPQEPHPERHPRRGRVLPHVPRVRPLRRGDRRAPERRHDLHEHREGRGLRARHAAGARRALRGPGRRVLRGHARGRALQARRHGRQHRAHQEPGQPALLDGGHRRAAHAAAHLHARGGARVHHGRRAGGGHAQERPHAQAPALRDRAAQVGRPHRQGQEVARGTSGFFSPANGASSGGA